MPQNLALVIAKNFMASSENEAFVCFLYQHKLTNWSNS